MKARFIVAGLAASQILFTTTSLFAQASFGVVTPADKRAYHACIYAQYIGDYCRYHAAGIWDYSFRDCVIANGGCECALANGGFGYWGPDVDEACRALPRFHGR